MNGLATGNGCSVVDRESDNDGCSAESGFVVGSTELSWEQQQQQRLADMNDPRRLLGRKSLLPTNGAGLTEPWSSPTIDTKCLDSLTMPLPFTPEKIGGADQFEFSPPTHSRLSSAVTDRRARHSFGEQTDTSDTGSNGSPMDRQHTSVDYDVLNDDEGSISSPCGSTSTNPLSPPMSVRSVSSIGGSQSGADDDLPHHLFEAGWRKFYSKRENRHYYFNKNTQQSVWHQRDCVIGGELRGEHPQQYSPVERKRHHAVDEGEMQHNRTNCDSRGAAQQPQAGGGGARFVDSTDWDLRIVTNVKMTERLPLCFYAPHPEIEQTRNEQLRKIRQHFQELCSREGVDDIPPEALSRWIVESIGIGGPSNVDSLLPSGSTGSAELDQESGTAANATDDLLRELLNCVPIRLHSVNSAADARRQLSRYADGARHLADRSSILPADHRKQIKWQCAEMIDWLRQGEQNLGEPIEEYLNRLKFLRLRCQPSLIDAARPQLERLCAKVAATSLEMAAHLVDQHQKLCVKSGVDVAARPLPPPKANKTVACYSAQLRFASPRQPHVEMRQSDNDAWVYLTRGMDRISISSAYFFKLEQLYRFNCYADNKNFSLFLPRVWCMAKRYQTLLNDADPHESVSLFRSPPPSVFRRLVRYLNVSSEAFATPFNCYFRQFCSVFPDTDGYFGSRGTFSDFQPLEGSFVVVLPPLCHRLSEAYVSHMISLLSSAHCGPLSFAVILAEVQASSADGRSESQSESLSKRIRESGFCPFERTCVLPPFEHYYRHGAMQFLARDDPSLYVCSTSATQILVAQNAAGEQKWPDGEEAVEAAAAAFAQSPALVGAVAPSQLQLQHQHQQPPHNHHPQQLPADPRLAKRSRTSTSPP